MATTSIKEIKVPNTTDKMKSRQRPATMSMGDMQRRTKAASARARTDMSAQGAREGRTPNPSKARTVGANTEVNQGKRIVGNAKAVGLRAQREAAIRTPGRNSTGRMQSRSAGANTAPNFTSPTIGRPNANRLKAQAQRARNKGGNSTTRMVGRKVSAPVRMGPVSAPAGGVRPRFKQPFQL